MKASPRDPDPRHLDAISELLNIGVGRAAGMLTPYNCRKHLSGLPQDVDVVSVDPITLEVARNRLAAIADEMGLVLRRTAYSPNIKERAPLGRV